MEKIHLSWLGQCYEILLSILMWRSGLVPIVLGLILVLAFIATIAESKTTKKEFFELLSTCLLSYIGLLFFILIIIIGPYSVYYFFCNSKSDLDDIDGFKKIVLDDQSNNIISSNDKIILNNAVKEILKDGKITGNEIDIYINYSSKLINKRKEEKIFKELNSGKLEAPNEE